MKKAKAAKAKVKTVHARGIRVKTDAGQKAATTQRVSLRPSPEVQNLQERLHVANSKAEAAEAKLVEVQAEYREAFDAYKVAATDELENARKLYRDQLAMTEEIVGLACGEDLAGIRKRLGVTGPSLTDRITTNPTIFSGKPVIRGHRLAVEHVLGMLAAGESAANILAAYPKLAREDIAACLAYIQQQVLASTSPSEQVVPVESPLVPTPVPESGDEVEEGDEADDDEDADGESEEDDPEDDSQGALEGKMEGREALRQGDRGWRDE